MRRTACPEGRGETSPLFDDEKTPPYFLLTPTADNVLTDTAHHQEHFSWLEDKVRSHYHATGMYKQFPERAEMLVARWVNNAGQVAARALADEEVMRRFMAMRDPGDLMLPYSVEEPMYAEGAGHLQTGEYGRFLQTMACHYLGALAAVFHHAQENSEHEGLWETLEAQQRNYRDAWCAYAREAEQRTLDLLDSALTEGGRRSMTITVPRVDAYSLGGLFALFERAVGFYASLVDVNAYHQPGVEAGKKAARQLLELAGRLKAELAAGTGSAPALAERLGADPIEVLYLLERLEATGRARRDGELPEATWRLRGSR